MADIAIFRINYKSDFILTLNSDAGWMTPFCIKFWTGAPSQAYYAYYDGMSYTHCAPVDGEPTKLLVQFDDHRLPIGDLKFQIGYHFTVDDFPTSVEDEVINQASVIIEVDDAPAQVMLDLNGETAPEIEFSLPAYANEAQRIANEQARIEAEQQRIANEDARIQAEETRQQNEQQRIAQETARVNEFATLKSQSQAATRDANDAATLANQKAQLAADKAALADDAATLAIQKAQLAADKAALANDAAQLAADKAALAQQKAEYAQQQGGYAKDQGDYAKNQGDYAKAQGDTAQADHERAEADHGIAVDDHTQAGNDHTRAESDHDIAVDDHTQAGNDHTRAESDHGIAADDHTQAGNDHTRAESDHTRAESDHAAVEVYVDSLGVFDLSKHNAVGGVLATYADIDAAINALNALDSQYKYGGMSFKFIQSSDNKYVQARCMAQNFTTDVTQWQGVDDEPIAGSKNLVESGGVFNISKNFGLTWVQLAEKLGKMSIPSGQGTNITNLVAGGYYNTDYKWVENANFKSQTIVVDPTKIYRIVNVNHSWIGVLGIALLGVNDECLGGIQTLSQAQDFVFIGVSKIVISTSVRNNDVSIVILDNALDLPSMLTNINKVDAEVKSLNDWGGVEMRTVEDVVISGNLLKNAELILDGGYVSNINNDGTLVFTMQSSSASAYKTYLLPVDGLSTYLFTMARFLVLMQDKEHAVTGATLQLYKTSISSVGASFIVFSFNTASYPISSYQVGIGTLRQNPEYTIPYLKVNRGNMGDNSVPTAAIEDGAVTTQKTAFSNKGKNLFNVNDADIVLNAYLSNNTITTGGSVAPLYNVTGYIPVEPNTTYQMSNDGDVIHDTYLGRFICQYNEDKGYLSGIDITATLDDQQFTTGPNTHFVRISVKHPYWEKYQVEKGTIATAWEAFGYYFGIEYLPTGDIATNVFQPNQGFSKYSGTKTLAQNATLNLPQSYIRKNIAFTALISGANSANLDVLVGLGYNKYDGGWLELTPTKVIVHKYESSDTTTEYTHGLTLAEDVIVNFDAGTTDAVIKVISDGQIFSQQIDRGFYFAGAGFVTNKGDDSIDASLVVMPKDITKKVWMFGDSYLGWLNSQRWPYWMLEWGFDAWLGDARPGGNSAEGLVSFYNDVRIGKPVYLIWANGMNDTGDTNVDTPDSTWLANEQSVINKCESIGVVPVLATIPSVPSKIHDGKNKWIRESGYRYIDFAFAVGATSTGVWKAGMLSGDNIHPTELGAKALASQVLIDFPEIMIE